MKKLKKFEDYKYHADFGAFARCLQDSEKSKFLALASLDDLKLIIPEQALTDGFEDLLPIAANACVANLANRRGDMISTETALAIRNDFVHKFIDIEHDRKIIVGHLANSGLSKFHSDYKIGVGSESLKAEALASTTEPFNISLAGYIYAVAFPDIAKKIIEANDPESENYLTISLSWELAFDTYKIAIGHSNVLSECEIISDPKDIEKYSKFLKCNKGSGSLSDGRNVYRLIDDGVIPLGVALTFAPAGQVTGVFTNVKMQTEANLDDKQQPEQPKEVTAEVTPENNSDKKTEKVSQVATANVTSNITKAMKTLKSFADLKNLNDENKADTSFANITNILDAEIEKIAKDYQGKIEAEANEKKELKLKADEAIASVETLKKEVAALQQAQASQEAVQKFNDRMQGLDDKYELNDSDRKAIASDIKGLDDDSFTKWSDKFETYASAKKKDVIAAAKAAKDAADKKDKPADDKDADDKKKKDEAKASDDTEAARVAAEALKNVAGKPAAIANTVETQTSLTDKYKKAFAVGEGVEIVSSNRRA